VTAKRLRIGLFVIAFPRLSETFIVTKVLKLLDAGFDVQIFTLSSQGDWGAFRVLDGRDDVRSRVHPIPPVTPLWRVATKGAFEIAKTAISDPSAFAKYTAHTWRHRNDAPQGFLKALYEHIRFVGHELDILHVEFDYQGVGIADLKELLNCRLLLSSRGTLESASTFSPRARDYLFRYADGYHFISTFLERDLEQLGLSPTVRRWHIEPAIDLSLFKPLPRERPSEAIRIVSVGRLTWAKGYEFGLDAIAQLRDRGVDFHYSIYGWGPYEDAVRFSIRQLGLTDRVSVMGKVSREEVRDVYASADIMLHASVDEGFCNAVIEAQAMQVPVVTTDAGGLVENVANDVTGFVVPRRDARALADKLELLSKSAELRMRMGKAGRARALERFDLDRQAEAFVALYRELANQPLRRSHV
jgi:colanic acid/amylovoran biosynthesis glycosyltransferase